MSSARARSSLLPLLSSASYACGSDVGRDGRTPWHARSTPGTWCIAVFTICKIHGRRHPPASAIGHQRSVGSGPSRRVVTQLQ